jgi:hypothetical protein
MTDEAEATIRRAMGGDPDAIAWISAVADGSDDAALVTMAALLDRRLDLLDRAEGIAATSRHRQVVAIARAHLRDEDELVDALARDHLVDFPDSVVVAWIAAASAGQGRGPDSP